MSDDSLREAVSRAIHWHTPILSTPLDDRAGLDAVVDAVMAAIEDHTEHVELYVDESGLDVATSDPKNDPPHVWYASLTMLKGSGSWEQDT